ncbi:MAG: hypothetical protein AB7N24_16690 [Dehalococcoidia bacterium]
MNSSRFLSPRRLITLTAFSLIAVMAYGFAAANTVDPSNAGDGHGAVSGGDIENVHYVVSGGYPSELTKVQFNYVGYSKKPTYVDATLDVGATTSTSTCSNTSGDAWECDFSGVNVEDVEDLQVTSHD